MPFYFAQLPSYKPKPQIGKKEKEPFTSKYMLQKTKNGNLAAAFKKEAYHPKYDAWLINKGVAEVQIEENWGKISFSYSPLGLKHALVAEQQYSRYMEDMLRNKENS